MSTEDRKKHVHDKEDLQTLREEHARYEDALKAIDARGPATEPEFETTWTPEVTEAMEAGELYAAWVAADIARRALTGKV